MITNLSKKSAVREAIEDLYPACDGWLWPREFLGRTGVPQFALHTACADGTWKTKGRCSTYFQRTPFDPYRYRVCAEYTEPAPDLRRHNERAPKPLHTRQGHCVLCACKTTRNRTLVLEDMAVCYPCHRLVFVDHDYETRRRLGL